MRPIEDGTAYTLKCQLSAETAVYAAQYPQNPLNAVQMTLKHSDSHTRARAHTHTQCTGLECCRVLQGAAECCRMLQGGAGWCKVVQGVAGCRRVL